MIYLSKLVYAALFGLLLCCDEGWVPNDTLGYCYKVYTNSPKTWSKSKQFCEEANSTLVELTDSREQLFVNTLLSGLVNAHAGAWIGASQDSRSTWRWTDNSVMDINFYLWKKGNPDNNGVILEGLPNSENCVLISLESSSNGTLNDFICRRKMPFVCEVKDTSPVTMTTAYTTTVGAGTEHVTTMSAVLPVLLALVVLIIAGIALGVIIFANRRRSAVNNYETTRPAATYNTEHAYEDMDTAGETENYYDAISNEQSGIYSIPDVCNSSHGATGIDHRFGSSYCDITVPNKPINIAEGETENNQRAKPGQALSNTTNTNILCPKYQSNKNRLEMTKSGYVDFEVGNDKIPTSNGKRPMLFVKKSMFQKKSEMPQECHKSKKVKSLINGAKRVNNAMSPKTGNTNERVQPQAKSQIAVKLKPKPTPKPKLTGSQDNSEYIEADSVEVSSPNRNTLW